MEEETPDNPFPSCLLICPEAKLTSCVSLDKESPDKSVNALLKRSGMLETGEPDDHGAFRNEEMSCLIIPQDKFVLDALIRPGLLACLVSQVKEEDKKPPDKPVSTLVGLLVGRDTLMPGKPPDVVGLTLRNEEISHHKIPPDKRIPIHDDPDVVEVKRPLDKLIMEGPG